MAEAERYTLELADARLWDDAGLDEASFPIAWETAGYAWVARRFTGWISAARQGADATEITVSATFDSRGAAPSPPELAAADGLVGTLLRNLRTAVEEHLVI